MNLPKFAIEAKGNIDKFWKIYDKYIKLSKKYLEYRYSIIAQKKGKNFPFIIGQNIYMDSEKIGPEDSVEPCLRHSSLSIGYCGLAECLIMLTGKHHGESEESQELGLKIIGHLREMTDKFTKQTGLNWSTFASPAESTAGRLAKYNRKKYGLIPGVTDRDFLSNSNHIPVWFPICAHDKIRLEAPYHSLANAGNITYIEWDGDPLENLEAFEKVVLAMKEGDLGYFSIKRFVPYFRNEI